MDKVSANETYSHQNPLQPNQLIPGLTFGTSLKFGHEIN